MGQENNKQHISFLNARVTSIISISLVLFLLGTVVSLSIIGTQLTKHIKENMGFTIVIKDSASKRGIESVKRELDKAPYVKAVQFISKEDALKELELELGESPKDLLGFNPLQSSIEIKLLAQYASTDSLAWIEAKIKEHREVVSEVICQKDVIQVINDNLRKAEIILLSISVILMVISFALISNTIRLMAYSRRFLIHTMKLVGANWGFIRWPFLRRNIWSGVLSGIIADGILMGAAYLLVSYEPELIGIITPNVMLIVSVSVLLFGVIITFACAYASLNKFLRMRASDLYYI